MEFHSINYISPGQCVYTIDGQKLIEIRKAKLVPFAGALDIEVTGETSKNELVGRMIVALDAMGAPHELTEMKKKKAKKKVAKKK